MMLVTGGAGFIGGILSWIGWCSADAKKA